MNLADVIDPTFGLLTDDKLGTRLGPAGQLEVIGWSGKRGSAKKYVVRCSICRSDAELYGEGMFNSLYSNLTKNTLPCGCGQSRHTAAQYVILASRECERLGLTFIGWAEDFRGIGTRCRISCRYHGEYCTTGLNSLLNASCGCRACADEKLQVTKRKSDHEMTTGFLASGKFHPDTNFTRSDKVTRKGRSTLWHVDCPVCNSRVLSDQTNLAAGKIPCLCSYAEKQTEGYINLLYSGSEAVALKFGISSASAQRIKTQGRSSALTIVQFGIWKFPDYIVCRAAENSLKERLIRGIIPREIMPDGHTETAHLYSLPEVINTYEKFGGVRLY